MDSLECVFAAAKEDPALGMFDRFTRRSDRAATPPDPQALIAEGNAAEDEGRLADALKAYDQAIAVAPEFARAHLNRGNALMGLQDFDASIKAFETALRHDPALAGAHYNLGNVFARQQRYEEACSAYQEALSLQPGFVDADAALGSALGELGKLEGAVLHLRRALQAQPGLAQVYGNLGGVLIKQGQLAEAEACFRRALELDPNLTELYFQLGIACELQGLRKTAIDAYRMMLRSHPDHGQTHCLLGIQLQLCGQLLESIECYRRVLEMAPRDPTAHINLGLVYQLLGRLDEAAATWRRALEFDPHNLDPHSNLVLLENNRSSSSPAAVLELARSFGDTAAGKAKRLLAWPNTPEPERVLRVGFVSGDLRAHPVGYFLLSFLAALKAHAADRLEVHAYFNHGKADSVSDQIRARCHVWRQVNAMDDAAVVRQIGEDRIDILIDLSGHSGDNRLPAFAWKPAPVQATWLGYLGTTGVAAIDYLIADAWTLPPQFEPHFTEKVWRLPQSYLCFTPPGEDDTIGPLPALANGHVTFGSFNNLIKLGPDVVSLWARILHAVPGSRLLLKTNQFIEPSVRQDVAQRFARHGIGGSRLALEPPVARADYLKPYNRVDIALDPFPYTGITTSVECLWMGVPFITLAGNSFMSSQGVGLLNNAGLPDWIAADADDYVKLAARRAGELQLLQQLRQELRPRLLASPIFDAPSFARNFESAMRDMWRAWCASNS
jgi:predicted O-linked N-acetylglucosamine transferase (SPINDLY family)